MAERSNAHDSKSCDAGMYPRVQIPFSAPKKRGIDCLAFFDLFLRVVGNGERSLSVWLEWESAERLEGVWKIKWIRPCDCRVQARGIPRLRYRPGSHSRIHGS